MPDCPPLDWRQVARARAGSRVGGTIIYRTRVESTNTLARLLARDGAPDGMVVLADEQTRGRGRHGRRWIAPTGSGLVVSVLLRLPQGFPLHTLTMAVALAAGDAVNSVVGERCTLKWPNDILVDGAKVGGILLELEEADDGWVVVAGLGLNVNAAPELPHVTCLAAVAGATVVREPLLLDLLDGLDTLLTLAHREPEMIVRRWRERLATLGRRVRVQAPECVIEGVVIDVDATGALLVRMDDGTVRPVHAGDVTLFAEAPPSPQP